MDINIIAKNVSLLSVSVCHQHHSTNTTFLHPKKKDPFKTPKLVTHIPQELGE